MNKMKRWGVMALVAVLVLGTMGAALADDVVETDKEPLEPGFHELKLGPTGLPDLMFELVTFVLYWGDVDWDTIDPPPACEPEDLADDTTQDTAVDAASVNELCEVLDVSGPNGQVNHGSFVSSFVHWLKDDGMKALKYDGPKGQLVKWASGQDFGKGSDEYHGGPVKDAVADLEKSDLDDDDDDGNGPPEWVKAKKAAKATGKKK